MCLPGAKSANHTPSLLGFGCAVNEQCTLKVPNSQCVNGMCKCKSNFTPIRRDKCLPPAKLEDYCLNNEMCMMANEYLYCKWIIPRIYGKCKCPNNYVLTKDEQCMPMLESKCSHDEHCAKITPNSECKSSAFSRDSTCLCKDGYNATKGNNEENVTSISVVSLGKSCKSSLECRIRDPFSTCLNGVCECIDRTSECSVANRGCYNDTFQCRNGKCISWYFVCDKTVHCDDGSDEDVCNKYDCPKEAFQCGDGTCLSRGSVCNGRWECPDGSDEAQCYRGGGQSSAHEINCYSTLVGIKCNSRLHQCKSGQCLPQHTFCNTITECLDASDENPDVCENGN
ncbi:low-density lipoprotein receptor-related protein 8-like protein [Leptotrombidium deliense]|uniref:Low-density lipoprotein receptor-related protein 8-like protein n=1 Tax=Leptotrombidium deliense TaxID=299467 RepID=A0A443SRT6_9ACAR|nr:low-density lipoprotein receptor-related protein 8-like protein [Leptotrombidium deliense]